MLSTKQIICEMENCTAKVNDCLNEKRFAETSLWLGRLHGYCLLLQQIVEHKSREQSNETPKK